MDNDQVALGHELRAMEEERERTPADVMHGCGHEAACLRVMGMLCFGDGGYSGAVTTPEEDERAARWMGCDTCEHWEGRR